MVPPLGRRIHARGTCDLGASAHGRGNARCVRPSARQVVQPFAAGIFKDGARGEGAGRAVFASCSRSVDRRGAGRFDADSVGIPRCRADALRRRHGGDRRRRRGVSRRGIGRGAVAASRCFGYEQDVFYRRGFGERMDRPEPPQYCVCRRRQQPRSAGGEYDAVRPSGRQYGGFPLEHSPYAGKVDELGPQRLCGHGNVEAGLRRRVRIRFVGAGRRGERELSRFPLWKRFQRVSERAVLPESRYQALVAAVSRRNRARRRWSGDEYDGSVAERRNVSPL